MSEVISLSTFHNHNLTDQDHALFMQTVTSQSGLFYGCEVTLKDENTLHVSTGEGIACGRIFRIMDMDYPVELSASGDLLGRLYVHIDTALDDTPAQLMDVQGSTLPALIQEDDMNQSTGVYEIELATFSINELGISNLEFTAPKATGGGAGGKSIAPDYSATESYEKGRIFFQNGTLYKTIAAIPAGAPLVVDTNVVETSLAAEIEALNQNLMTLGGENAQPADKWTVLQAQKGNNVARFQINALGATKTFTSTDAGNTWKEISNFVRYDADTDMEYVIINGQRKNIRKAYLQGLTIFRDGQAIEPLSKEFSFSNATNMKQITTVNNYLNVASPSNQYSTNTIGTANKIDLTSYNTVHVVLENTTEYTADITSVTGKYYLIFNNLQWANQTTNFNLTMNCVSGTSSLALSPTWILLHGASSATTYHITNIFLT